MGSFVWTGDGDGTWSDKRNWGDVGPPRKGDSALIPGYVNGPAKGALVDKDVDQLKELTLASGFVSGGKVSVTKEVQWLGGEIVTELEEVRDVDRAQPLRARACASEGVGGRGRALRSRHPRSLRGA